MYTEISHFLLLHAISQEILRFIYLVSFWSLWRVIPKRSLKKAIASPRTYTKRRDSVYQVYRSEPLLTISAKREGKTHIRNLRRGHEWISMSLGKRVANSAWMPRRSLAFFFYAPMDGQFQPDMPGENCFPGTPIAPIKSDLIRHGAFSTFFLILTSCFFGTISSYICSDFSIYNILTNSTADIPLFYKISATWSNHEGSLLLWCWLLSFNTFLFCISICAPTPIVRFVSLRNPFVFAVINQSLVAYSNRQMYMSATRFAARRYL